MMKKFAIYVLMSFFSLNAMDKKEEEKSKAEAALEIGDRTFGYVSDLISRDQSPIPMEALNFLTKLTLKDFEKAFFAIKILKGLDKDNQLTSSQQWRCELLNRMSKEVFGRWFNTKFPSISFGTMPADFDSDEEWGPCESND